MRTISNHGGTATAPTPPGRWGRAGRAPLLAALVGLMLVGVVPAGSATANPKSRAEKIMSQSYGAFLTIKRGREAPFNWHADGCSLPTPPNWALEQNGPCQQHDFGYGNFGQGLRLEATESRRAWIDQRWLDEMRRNCREHWWYTSCSGGIDVMYRLVRAAGEIFFYEEPIGFQFQSLNVGGVGRNRRFVFACDLEADGRGLRTEYHMSNGVKDHVGDANGSKPGCGAESSGTTIDWFRVCEGPGEAGCKPWKPLFH